MHNIVYITDNNYVLPTKASINSIVRNCADTELAVHVIAVEVSEENQKALRNLASKNVVVEVLNFSNEFSDLGLDHLYVSKAALFKFQLPNIFTDLDAILYIDGDTVLNPGFEAIFDTDIKNAYAAVVMDMYIMKFGDWHKKMGHEFYFNSGMMYLNLKRMREDNISDKLIDYKRNDKENAFMDQNALNCVFNENVLYLSPQFNYLDEYRRKFAESDIADFYQSTAVELSSPLIRHLAGGIKPWKSADADNADDWIGYVLPDDMLKVAKNYCVSLSKDFMEHFSHLEEKCSEQEIKLGEHERHLSEQEQRISEQERRISEQERRIFEQEQRISEQERCLSEQTRKIEALQAKLNETHALLINTRHRTLYGACAWLFRKVFKKR